MEWTVKSTNAQTGMMIQKQLLMGWVSERAAQGPFTLAICITKIESESLWASLSNIYHLCTCIIYLLSKKL